LSATSPPDPFKRFRPASAASAHPKGHMRRWPLDEGSRRGGVGRRPRCWAPGQPRHGVVDK
jgi:hypothetical protein